MDRKKFQLEHEMTLLMYKQQKPPKNEYEKKILRKPINLKDGEDKQSRISNETKNADFNDLRLNRRLGKLLEQFAENPSVSIPEACNGWAETKAAYRFFDCEKVKPEIIRNSHIESTVERIKDEDIILVVQDTTNLDFTNHPNTKGMGYLDSKFASGLKVHSSIAISPKGVPKGLLHQEVWARDPDSIGKSQKRSKKPIKEKESQRWITTLEKLNTLIPKEKKVIVISDRESDIYELFVAPRNPNTELLIRAYQNRKINDEEEKLKTVINNTKSCGTIKITLNRRDNRPSREATLEVKYKKVEILPPKRLKNLISLKPVVLYAVLVNEIKPPKNEKGVNWLLHTTMKVESFDDCVQIVEWYSYRWLIERYHFVLKSGCKIEKLQLETRERIENALAVFCIVAWLLLWLTYESRKNPDAPCTIVLENYEWKALYMYVNKTTELPPSPPTLKEAVVLIAKLGGFLGRKGDKSPGVKTIWRGLRRLNDIVAMYLIMDSK